MLRNRVWPLVITLVFAMSLAACGGGGGGGGTGGDSSTDRVAPTVARTFPSDGTTTGLTNVLVGVTFAENNAMDETSVQNGLKVYEGPPGDTSNPVSGVVTYDATTKTATFTSKFLYTPGMTYWAKVDNSVADLAGNPISAASQWSFTISASAINDTTPPSVDLTTPGDGDTNVSVSSNIQIQFDKEMSSTDLNATTVKLIDETDPANPTDVLLDYVYNNGTMILTATPRQTLAANHDYRLTVSAEVRSAAGVPMGTAYQISFSTAAPAPPPPPGGTQL